MRWRVSGALNVYLYGLRALAQSALRSLTDDSPDEHRSRSEVVDSHTGPMRRTEIYHNKRKSQDGLSDPLWDADEEEITGDEEDEIDY